MSPPPNGTGGTASPSPPDGSLPLLQLLLRKVVLRPHSVPPAWWFAFACLLVAGDYAVGPRGQFAFTFIVPVFLSAWYSGLTAALVLAVGLPLVHLAMMLTVWDEPSVSSAIGAVGLRIFVLGFQAMLVARLADHERALQHEVDLLEELLPICMHCKAIRNDTGQWETLERYISARSDTNFTHGICDRCVETHHPEIFNRKGDRGESSPPADAQRQRRA